MMKAVARRRHGKLEHDLQVRDHRLKSDEAQGAGGEDKGPNPQELLAASLASCSAITMEMYAERKGWDIGDVVVEVGYEPAQRGSPTRFELDRQAAQGAARGAARAAADHRQQVPRAPHARGRGHVRGEGRAGLGPGRRLAALPHLADAEGAVAQRARRPAGPTWSPAGSRCRCPARGRPPARGASAREASPRPRASGAVATHHTLVSPSWSAVMSPATASPDSRAMYTCSGSASPSPITFPSWSPVP